MTFCPTPNSLTRLTIPLRQRSSCGLLATWLSTRLGYVWRMRCGGHSQMTPHGRSSAPPFLASLFRLVWKPRYALTLVHHFKWCTRKQLVLLAPWATENHVDPVRPFKPEAQLQADDEVRAGIPRREIYVLLANLLALGVGRLHDELDRIAPLRLIGLEHDDQLDLHHHRRHLFGRVNSGRRLSEPVDHSNEAQYSVRFGDDPLAEQSGGEVWTGASHQSVTLRPRRRLHHGHPQSRSFGAVQRDPVQHSHCLDERAGRVQEVREFDGEAVARPEARARPQAPLLAASEFGVSELPASGSYQHGFESHSVIEVALVEREASLVEVAEQVERLNADVCPVQAALQQAPEVLHAVGVDASVHIRLGVVDGLVGVVGVEAAVGGERVRVDGRSRFDAFADTVVEGAALDVGDDLCAYRAAALDHPEHLGLVHDAGAVDLPLAVGLVHIPRLA